MSESTIWSALRAGGLSEAGTAGVMGNFYCESLLKSNNVEDRCSLSDEDYTYNADKGMMSKAQFQGDGYGYGLYQLTYWSRKAGFWDLAKSRGVSIADEKAQCDYCLMELKQQYSSLYQYLCSTTDVYTAASRFCCEFERPAVNNVGPRASKALDYFSRYSGTVIDESSTIEEINDVYIPKTETTESCDITVRTVRVGDTGTDVAMLQTGLNRTGYTCGSADGIFGVKTKTAVTELQEECNLNVTGIADADVWQLLFQ